MQFYKSKTELEIDINKHNSTTIFPDLPLNNNIINPIESKNLGLIITDTLNFNQHLLYIPKYTSFHL